MQTKFISQANVLHICRMQAKLKKQDVARSLGVSNQFYGHLEHGYVGIPRRFLKPLCKVFKLKALNERKMFHDELVSDFARLLRKDLGL